MLKIGKDDLAVLCALLSIWICAIISANQAADSKARTALAAEGPGMPVLIVDPGHGGLDGGAVSVTGTAESTINWAVSVRLRDLCRWLGLPIVMTRQQEEILYPEELRSIAKHKRWDTRQRLGLINGTADAFLLSIHQNTYPSTQPSGPQTLYSRNETAAALARQLQELLNDVLSPPYRRSAAAAGNDIYLMAHAARPAVLVECGFLSNPREAAALETPVYQKTLSVVLTAGWVRFTGDEHLESENVVLLQGMRQ